MPPENPGEISSFERDGLQYCFCWTSTERWEDVEYTSTYMQPLLLH
jgi:hypothetical protein